MTTGNKIFIEGFSDKTSSKIVWWAAAICVCGLIAFFGFLFWGQQRISTATKELIAFSQDSKNLQPLHCQTVKNESETESRLCEGIIETLAYPYSCWQDPQPLSQDSRFIKYKLVMEFQDERYNFDGWNFENAAIYLTVNGSNAERIRSFYRYENGAIIVLPDAKNTWSICPVLPSPDSYNQNVYYRLEYEPLIALSRLSQPKNEADNSK